MIGLKFNTLAKQNAKKALGNRWGGAIAVVLMISAISLLFSILESMFTVFFGLPDFYEILACLLEGRDLPPAAIPSVIISGVFAVLGFLVLTPLKLGVTNWLYQLTGGQPREISSLFFFFDSPCLFFKSLFLRLGIAVRMFFWAVLCLSPGVVFTGIGDYLARPDASAADHALAAAGITLGSILLLLGFAALWICSFRYFLAGYLLCADPDLGVGTVIRLSVRGTRGRLSKLAQFQLSFLGWYLLCFLVLPLLYVAPYTGASMAIYARYLIERDNLIPRQESPTGRIVDQDYIDLGPQPD